jgi:hypothetical protein
VSFPADAVAAGDLDGDDTYDLIGVWSTGLWVKYSFSKGWTKISTSHPLDLDAGHFRKVTWYTDAVHRSGFDMPVGAKNIEGPGNLARYKDLSDRGPGGENFVYQEASNLYPQEMGLHSQNKSPGPGEPGFVCIEQENLAPRERAGTKNVKKK